MHRDKDNARTCKDSSVITEKKMQLIQLVKEYPILYDLANPDHKNWYETRCMGTNRGHFG